jgi:hypothetical protein
MAIKLTLESLSVEAFSTTSDTSDGIESTSSMAPTYYGCSCGCGTYDGCPSDEPNCTTPCVVESGKTDWYACCG